MFVMYIVADFCWLYFEPEAIPSLHNVIYFHHIVTLLLLLFPLAHKEFSSFTCLDGKPPVERFLSYIYLMKTPTLSLFHWFQPSILVLRLAYRQLSIR